MNDDYTWFWAIVLVVGLFFFFPLLATFIGYWVGWVVGMFFEETIRNVLLSFGVDSSNYTIAQLGATLAFIGSFFKSTNTTSTKS